MLRLDPEKPVKILLQRTDRLGDVVCIVPVIEAIHEHYPLARIHVLTSPIGAAFLRSHPLVETCHVLSAEEKDEIKWKEMKRVLKQESFKIVIHLYNTPKMAWLAYNAKIPIRIGDSTNWPLSLLYTHTVRQTWEDISAHQIEFNLELLSPLKIGSDLRRPKLIVEENAYKKIELYLKKHIAPDKKKLLIFTGTGGTNKPIPEAAVAAFIERVIKEDTEWVVILAGQKSKETPLDHIMHESVLNMMEKTETLDELSALISQVEMYMGPDTGPTHIAGGFNIPLIFFSSMKPNPPLRWGSLSSYQRIIRREYACPYVCIKGCHPDECFGFVTGEVLYNEFEQLNQEISVKEEKSIRDCKYYHAAHTFRVLVITTDEARYQKALQTQQNLKESPLKFFIFKVDKWSFETLRFAIKKVLEYNINIIQSEMPQWMVSCIQLYIGAVIVYTKPHYVEVPLLPAFTERELLKLYINTFREIHDKEPFS